MTRRAGVLIPLFSIRSRSGWGLGEIPDLVPFARWARGSGFSLVQMLPVLEASHGQSSPYGALTTFALDPVYLSLDQVPDFAAAGGREALSPDDQRTLAEVAAGGRVDWARIRPLKRRALERAFASFRERELHATSARADEFSAFCRREAHWLEEYTLFTALHEAHEYRWWRDWAPPLRDRDREALSSARIEHHDRIVFHAYVQWLLDAQWREARGACEAIGVGLVGDLPFVVATDSADVWARQDEFRVDAQVGVPPDAFSAEGQAWGLPVYRWDVMDRNDFAWMRARAARAAALFASYRVDHVVGFYRTYVIPEGKKATEGVFFPAEEPLQIRLGETLLRILKVDEAGSRVIAEDLGTVPDFVRASLTRLGIPGYRVLRWERDDLVYRDPAKWPALSLATTGTHDTEPLVAWYDALPEDERKAFLAIPGLERLRERAPARLDDEGRDEILGLTLRSGSDVAVLPFEDCFGLTDRVNLPGTVSDDNWSFRTPMTVEDLERDETSQRRLAALVAAGGRSPA